MDIDALLAHHESNLLEFNEQMPGNEKLAALLCAFANTAGGDLIVGIEDKTKEFIGIPEDEILALEEKVAAIAATSISPMILPLIRIVRHHEKLLLVVHVDMGFQKPYAVTAGKQKGEIFVRVGSSTRAADSATKAFLTFRTHGTTWDSLPCEVVVAEDLDKSLIADFLSKRYERRSIEPPRRIDIAWMKRAKLAVEINGRVCATRGAVLLFAQNPQEIFPESGLEMARFQGDTNSFIDKVSVNGSIWKFYDEALAFLRRNIPVEAVRTSGALIETRRYPEIAFREFLINALCHRSYESNASSTKCAIFDDSIRITNPGILPEGLDIEDLGTGVSVVRNPLIARAFNELGLIEGWGTGISTAQKQLAKHGLPPASITTRGFFIQVDSIWRWGNTVTTEQERILRHIAQHGKITSSEVASIRGTSERSARTTLKEMAEAGYIRRKGSTRGTEYVLG